MNRLCYIPKRLAIDFVSLISRAINAIVFGGSTAQTLSARAYLDGDESALWRAIGKGINAMFFWEPDHIKAAWESEVERARHVLDRLK